MSYYKVEKIYPWLYSIYDPQAVYCYVIVGQTGALLYDTAYGIAPLDPVVRQITPLPYQVVLSHGHIDHVNGAHQFDQVLIHQADEALCRSHSSPTARGNIIQGLQGATPPDNWPLDLIIPGSNPPALDLDSFAQKGCGNLQFIGSGHIFDLGGLTVEVVSMEGHTAGSIGLLVKEHRVLLDSDAANQHIWMFLEESLSMATYIRMLKRVKELPFDTFFVGHQNDPRPKIDFDKYIAVAENINPDQAKPYHTMLDLEGYLYEKDGMGVVFHPSKL